MYQEQDYDQVLPPAVLIDPAFAQHTVDPSQCCDGEAHSLESLLRQLESLSIKIAHYNILRAWPTSPSAETTVDDAALAWMQNSLDNIAATLQRIATSPQEENQGKPDY